MPRHATCARDPGLARMVPPCIFMVFVWRNVLLMGDQLNLSLLSVASSKARRATPAVRTGGGDDDDGTMTGVEAGKGSSGNDTIGSEDETPKITTGTIDTADNVASGVDDIADVEEGFHEQPARTTRQSSLGETTERLEEAVAKLMKDYQRARKEVLYGLDDLGRPLEESGAAAAAGGGDEGGQGSAGR